MVSSTEDFESLEYEVFMVVGQKIQCKVYSDLTALSDQANPHNYDAWFDYLRLVESDAEPDAVRDVYERAIANIPPIQEKRHWRRYIYLWINYALYEELEVKVSLSTLL